MENVNWPAGGDGRRAVAEEHRLCRPCSASFVPDWTRTSTVPGRLAGDGGRTCVSDTIVTESPRSPPNSTCSCPAAPEKFCPVIVTDVPPAVGPEVDAQPGHDRASGPPPRSRSPGSTGSGASSSMSHCVGRRALEVHVRRRCRRRSCRSPSSPGRSPSPPATSRRDDEARLQPEPLAHPRQVGAGQRAGRVRGGVDELVCGSAGR